jgi:hypothetical protein
MTTTVLRIAKGTGSFCASIATATLALALPTLAAAQIGVELQRPVHMQGYWDHNSNDPGIVGTVTFAAKGTKNRVFGATAVQAYMDPEQGTQVFSSATMAPVITVEGSKDMVDAMMGAPANKKVNVFGMFIAEPSANFILMSVHIEPGPKPDASGSSKTPASN